MPRITIDRGALVTYYTPHDMPGAEIPLRWQVYDEKGAALGVKEKYHGPGEALYAPDGQRKELRIGADNATRHVWYTVDANPTEESEEYDRGYRAGWKRAGGPTENTIGTVTTTRGAPLRMSDADGTPEYNDGVRDGYAAGKKAKKGPKSNPRRSRPARQNPAPRTLAWSALPYVPGSGGATYEATRAGKVYAITSTPDGWLVTVDGKRIGFGGDSRTVRLIAEAHAGPPVIPFKRRNPAPRRAVSRLIPSSEREAEQWFAEADNLDASAAVIEAQAAAIDVARGKYAASPFYQQAAAQRERSAALRAAVRKYAATHGLPKCKPVKKPATCPRCGYPEADTRAPVAAPAAAMPPRAPEVWLPVKGTQRNLFARKNPRTCRCNPKDRSMKRRKTEHPIVAAQRLGEQFHRWQGAGLKKAIRLVMPRRNPDTTLHFTDLGDLYRAAVRATEQSDALDRENQARVDAGGMPDKAAITAQTNLIAELKAWVDGQDWFAYNGEAKPLLRWPTDAPWFRRRVARNPAGWQHAEASATVRRATQTGTLADRQAAHAALAKVAARRRPSPLPNPAKDAGAKAYRAAVLASRKASERRYNLPAGSSRAAVTTANARWRSAAEERDRLGSELPAAVRAAVDAELALSNPRRNPADPLAAKVTALRRAIRKAVAAHEAEGSDFGRHWRPVYRTLDKIEDFAWRNSLAFDGSPLRGEINAAVEEGRARRSVYLHAEGERIDSARRQAMNTPEARYAAEIQRSYGR